MTSFILKIVGVISMLFDHIGYITIGKFSNLNLIGRLSFPIFAFQTVQGYIHTKNLKKHIIKLFIFAIISQIPFMLFLSTFTNILYLNIFFTFLLATFAIFFYDKYKNKVLGFISVIFISIIAELIKVDYGAFGILLVFSFYYFRNNKIQMTISTLILCFGKYFINILLFPSHYITYILCAFFTSLSIVFILLYNNKQGPKSKYFFYIFYPLHLLILYFLYIIK